MSEQWSVKYRPTDLEGMIGNKKAVHIVKSILSKRNAHAILLYGKTGCGKSTLARILANGLSSDKSDIKEVNTGSFRGIEDVRSIVEQAKFLPRGKCKVIILEEAHALTPQAMDAFLRPLEDPPHSKVVFIFCTDRPWLLKEQLLGRLLRIELKQPTEIELMEYLVSVIQKERAFPKYNLKEIKVVAREISKASDYIPRVALQLLQSTASDYGNFKDAKDLIINSIRQTESASLDKNVLLILGCMYSKEKNVKEKANIITKSILSVDSISVVNRLIVLNFALITYLSMNPSSTSYYVYKELKGLNAIPKSDIALDLQMTLISLKGALATITMDPSHIILPSLLRTMMEINN